MRRAGTSWDLIDENSRISDVVLGRLQTLQKFILCGDYGCMRSRQLQSLDDRTLGSKNVVNAAVNETVFLPVGRRSARN